MWSERENFCIFHIDPETDVLTKHFITETWNLSVKTDKELETEKEREEKAFNAHRKHRQHNLNSIETTMEQRFEFIVLLRQHAKLFSEQQFDDDRAACKNLCLFQINAFLYKTIALPWIWYKRVGDFI